MPRDEVADGGHEDEAILEGKKIVVRRIIGQNGTTPTNSAASPPTSASPSVTTKHVGHHTVVVARPTGNSAPDFREGSDMGGPRFAKDGGVIEHSILGSIKEYNKVAALSLRRPKTPIPPPPKVTNPLAVEDRGHVFIMLPFPRPVCEHYHSRRCHQSFCKPLPSQCILLLLISFSSLATPLSSTCSSFLYFPTAV